MATVQPQRDRLDACLVFPSMPAVMRLNKLGTFSMAQLGQSKSPFVEFMRSARKNSDNFEVPPKPQPCGAASHTPVCSCSCDVRALPPQASCFQHTELLGLPVTAANRGGRAAALSLLSCCAGEPAQAGPHAAHGAQVPAFPEGPGRTQLRAGARRTRLCTHAGACARTACCGLPATRHGSRGGPATALSGPHRRLQRLRSS